jgi:hypothetical protein
MLGSISSARRAGRAVQHIPVEVKAMASVTKTHFRPQTLYRQLNSLHNLQLGHLSLGIVSVSRN